MRLNGDFTRTMRHVQLFFINLIARCVEKRCTWKLESRFEKIHTCGSDVISELEHRSLCGRNETRTVNLEEQSKKSATAQRANGKSGWRHGRILIRMHSGSTLKPYETKTKTEVENPAR